jgi:hypothetical protein
VSVRFSAEDWIVVHRAATTAATDGGGISGLLVVVVAALAFLSIYWIQKALVAALKLFPLGALATAFAIAFILTLAVSRADSPEQVQYQARIASARGSLVNAEISFPKRLDVEVGKSRTIAVAVSPRVDDYSPGNAEVLAGGLAEVQLKGDSNVAVTQIGPARRNILTDDVRMQWEFKLETRNPGVYVLPITYVVYEGDNASNPIFVSRGFPITIDSHGGFSGALKSVWDLLGNVWGFLGITGSALLIWVFGMLRAARAKRRRGQRRSLRSGQAMKPSAPELALSSTGPDSRGPILTSARRWWPARLPRSRRPR